MAQVQALVVGSLVMDLSFLVPKRPQPGEVIIAESFGTFRGGKGYNQAVALARLGARVTMIGAVGNDSNGREFLAALAREGVDTNRMVVVDDEPTSVAVPLVTTDGDVGFVHYPGANHSLRSEQVTDLPACDILLVQGEIPPETTVAAARAVAAGGGRVFLNPAPVHHVTHEMLTRADIICPNQVEAEALLGVSIESSDPLALARELAGDNRIAVITLGARGAAFAGAGEEAGVIAPPRISALDATGAGDSFCAALALALVEGRPLRTAVRFACAAGAHAATVRGAEPGLPTRAQVEHLLGRAKN
jgi:ribokinase